MVEKEVVLKNPSGMHARPASLFVAEAGKFPCEVTLRVGDKSVNGKSILGLLSLGIASGQAITLVTSGEQEEQALEALVNFVESGMGEQF